MFKYYYFLLLWVVVSCNSAGQKEKQPKATSDFIKMNNSIIPDNIYFTYLIDTSINFTDLKDLLDYNKKNAIRFGEFAHKLETETSNLTATKFADDSIIYLNQTLFNFLMKKYIESAEKNTVTLRCLGTILDCPDISDSEKLKLFSLFPDQLRNGSEGQQIFNRLNEYKRNIGIDMQQFGDLFLTGLDAGKTRFRSLFNTTYDYYVMIFGASWCKPCRYGNMVLKKRFDGIDTSKIRVIEISMDKDILKWKKWIDEDHPAWRCFLLEKNFQSEISQALKLPGVPRIFLIDKNYKVIAEHFDIKTILKKIPVI